MTDLVFFGAGASRPFGIPTMQEMVIEFEKTLKDNHPNLFEFYSKIKESLIKEYGDSKIDIESMLSVINGIATNTKSTELGHFVFYYLSDICSHKKFSSDEIALGKKLEKQLHDYIKETCKIKIKQDDVNKIGCRSYLSLFKHMSPNTKDYDGEKLSYDWKAYTTNYDNIFEDFWNMYGSLNDHFKKIDNSNNYYFTSDPLESEPTFCKLHGSLDWTKEVETHRIIRKTHVKFERNKTEGNIMLFPIQQKDLYLHPWFTLFQDLKIGLSQKTTWYVIGYAFNDKFIRNAFQESLVDNSNKKLVIINPEAESIKDKFLKSTRDQIDVLPIKFGDEFFDLQFKDYIHSVKTVVVRIRTRNVRINIESNKIISEITIRNLEKSEYEVSFFSERHDQILIKLNGPINKEIKIELEIQYVFRDVIELLFSDGTEKLNFGIDYGGIVVANSHEISGYEKLFGYGYTESVPWMNAPIVLDKSKLYISQLSSKIIT